jgi:NADH-quinone oxidoreductase subunit L
VSLLYLVIVIPFASALILAMLGGFMPRKIAGVLGCLSIGITWLISFYAAGSYLSTHLTQPYHPTLYQWLSVGSLEVPFGLYLDSLSLVMMCIVTFVGFLIHLYSVEYMAESRDYSLFFCYMNLFVGSMLLLLLADNLLLLYLGWEGVGLCSYLLIGFWRTERANGLAAQKAFIVTRVGDTALAIGLFLLFLNFGTLDIRTSLTEVSTAGSSALALTIALLIIGGAIGKSAQLPLQTWLPDAMAGPSPVSALIHAATMVTAGVYLIARMHPLFMQSPLAMLVVAIIGAVTACYGGLAALAQRDLKRILAYSTISQIGYMFLALGVGAWWAAIFHFVTHAFFKALLFLSAGSVVRALHEERDIYKMGGMFRQLPVAGWTFLIGAASLAALPLVTAGFYSKDAILFAAYTSQWGAPILWAAGVLSALLTGLYIFRAFFNVFWGEARMQISHRPGWLMNLPLMVLAFFSITAGFIGMPRELGGYNPFSHLLDGTFGKAVEGQAGAFVLVTSPLISLVGIAISYWLFVRKRDWVPGFVSTPVYRALYHFLAVGFGFDWLYDRLIVRPYVFLANINRDDFIDSFYRALAWLATLGNRVMSATESGRVRNYATGMLLGAVLLVVILLMEWKR